MRVNKQGGFTVIEVTIFLAVTGFLIVMVLMGTGTAISSARFSDSVRSFESFIGKQFNTVVNGVNTRSGAEICASGVVNDLSTSTPGTSDNCFLLGKYLEFTPGTSDAASVVTIQYVVGTQPTAPEAVQAGWNDTEAIKQYNPKAVALPELTETYDLAWGARINGALRKDSAAVGTPITRVALLHSPKSSSVYVYAFSGVTDLATAVANPAVNADKAVNLCVRSQDMVPTFGVVSFAEKTRSTGSIGARLNLTAADLTPVCGV